jgi:hypothetical protein
MACADKPLNELPENVRIVGNTRQLPLPSNAVEKRLPRQLAGPLPGPRHPSTFRPVLDDRNPPDRPEALWCVRCGGTRVVLLTSCPACGVLPLCVDCIVAHIADICAQKGRALGP